MRRSKYFSKLLQYTTVSCKLSSFLFSSVWINSWLPNEPSMPHEGWRNSGLGRTGGVYSMDFYTEFKSISIKFWLCLCDAFSICYLNSSMNFVYKLPQAEIFKLETCDTGGSRTIATALSSLNFYIFNISKF